MFLAFNNHISSSPIPYLALVDAPPLSYNFNMLCYISVSNASSLLSYEILSCMHRKFEDGVSEVSPSPSLSQVFSLWNSISYPFFKICMSFWIMFW